VPTQKRTELDTAQENFWRDCGGGRGVKNETKCVTLSTEAEKMVFKKIAG